MGRNSRYTQRNIWLKDSDPPVAPLNGAPEGYTWHHHQNGKTMILVDKKVDREFTHTGGVSIVNGN